MSVAVYVRVSTGLQVTEGHSLAVQEEVCIATALGLGFDRTDIEVFREEGYSGEDIDRPVLNQLVERIKHQDISHIVIKHPDRLSRNMTDKAIIVREFQQAGVKLVFVDVPDWNQSAEAELLFNIIGSIAQYELRQIRRRTMGGKLRAVRQGQVMPMGAVPYGYRYKDGQLFIEEAEARFVRQVYHWYVDKGLTMRQIGEELAAAGAIPRNGKTRRWGQTSILRILSSETYAGRFYYNRRKRVKLKGERTKSNRPKVRYEQRPPTEWVTVKVPAIIDEELYHRAQVCRLKNRRKGGNVRRHYLLRGLIRCGSCGRKWTATRYTGRNGKEYLYYRCPVIRTYGAGIPRCQAPSLQVVQLDDYVWDQIVNLFGNPKDYVQYLRSGTESVIGELEERHKNIGHQLIDHEDARKRIVQMYEEGFLTRNEMSEKAVVRQTAIENLKQEHLHLKRQLESLRQQMPDTRECLQTAEDIVAWLRTGEDFPFQLKRKVVELLMEELTLTFEESRPGTVFLTSTGVFDGLQRMQRCLDSPADDDLGSCS